MKSLSRIIFHHEEHEKHEEGRVFDGIYKMDRICLPRMSADRRGFIAKTEVVWFGKDVLQGKKDKVVLLMGLTGLKGVRGVGVLGGRAREGGMMIKSRFWRGSKFRNGYMCWTIIPD